MEGERVLCKKRFPSRPFFRFFRFFRRHLPSPTIWKSQHTFYHPRRSLEVSPPSYWIRVAPRPGSDVDTYIVYARPACKSSVAPVRWKRTNAGDAVRYSFESSEHIIRSPNIRGKESCILPNRVIVTALPCGRLAKHLDPAKRLINSSSAVKNKGTDPFTLVAILRQSGLVDPGTFLYGQSLTRRRALWPQQITHLGGRGICPPPLLKHDCIFNPDFRDLIGCSVCLATTMQDGTREMH